MAGTQSFSVTLKTAGSSTVTASDVTDVTKTANTSPSVTVNAGPFVKMQVLVPGETAAPGTATGKTGLPTARTANTAFNVTINAVDANWNLVSSTHTVATTSSDANALLPANGALSAGTRTVSVTLKTAGSQTVTATDITDGTKTANTSPTMIVNAGAASKLTIQTQPSSSATAGVTFAQQPVIRVEDASGNLITTDNGRVITAARSAGTGTLQGTLTATTVNGIATFANLSHNVATTITLNFTAIRTSRQVRRGSRRSGRAKRTSKPRPQRKPKSFVPSRNKTLNAVAKAKGVRRRPARNARLLKKLASRQPSRCASSGT